MVESQKESPQELTISLTLNEVNTIIEGLSQLPYFKVYDLVQKIHKEAAATPGFQSNLEL